MPELRRLSILGIISLILLASLFSVFIQPSKVNANTSKKPKAFILVPGFNTGTNLTDPHYIPSGFEQIHSALQSQYPDAVFYGYSYKGFGQTYNLTSTFGLLYDDSALLDKYMSQPDLQGRDVFLIGHSKGGAVAALYEANHVNLTRDQGGSKPTLAGVITFDSPLNGFNPLKWNACFYAALSGLGLYVSSPIMVDLVPGSYTPNTIQKYSIQMPLASLGSTDDCFVTTGSISTPDDSTYLASGEDIPFHSGGGQIWQNPSFHNAILSDSKAIDYMKGWIDGHSNNTTGNPTPTPSPTPPSGGSTCTNSPTFTNPPNGATVERSVKLAWNAPNSCIPDGYSLRINQSSDTEAKPWIVDTGVGPENYAYTFSSDGIYYVHVRACKTCAPYNPGPWTTIRIVVKQGSSNPPPAPTDGVNICQNANYGSPCSVFTYTGSNDTVQSLGSLSLNQDSLQFLGSYANSYDVVLCLKAGCPSSDREIQHDDPNFASSITQNQYVAIRIVKNAAPITTGGVQLCENPNFGEPCVILPVGKYNRGTTGPWSSNSQVSSVRYVNGWDSIHYHARLSVGSNNTGAAYNVDQNSISDLDNKDGNNQHPIDTFDKHIDSIEIYQQQAPNAPDSPSPADGTTVSSSTVTLQWSSADQSQIHIWGTNYDLWHSWDAISSLTVQNLPSGTYSWQAQRENAIGASPWSPTWTFIVPNAGPPTPLPDGSVKLGGLNLDAYCQSISLPVSGVINNEWFCGNGTAVLNLTNACQWQYANSTAFSFQEKANDPYSWNCYAPPTPPQGTWNSPSDNFTVAKNGTLHLSVNVTGSSVSTVVIRGIWGTTPWTTLCTFAANDSHVYACDWNPADHGVSDNTVVRTAFDAFNTEGSNILPDPDGDRVGTYSPPIKLFSIPDYTTELVVGDNFNDTQQMSIQLERVYIVGAPTSFVSVSLDSTNVVTILTPQPSDVGIHTFQVCGTFQGETECGTYTIRVYASGVNLVGKTFSLTEGQTQSFTITPQYGGTNPLSVQANASTLPKFATFKDNGNGSGTLTLTPPKGSSGTYSVYIYAMDNSGLFGSDYFTVKVSPAPVTCIPGTMQVSFYANTNYGGTCVTKNIGNYTTASAMGIANHTVSSIKLGSGVKVTVFSSTTYTGTSHLITGNIPNLATVKFDNLNSSAKIVKK